LGGCQTSKEADASLAGCISIYSMLINTNTEGRKIDWLTKEGVLQQPQTQNGEQESSPRCLWPLPDKSLEILLFGVNLLGETTSAQGAKLTANMIEQIKKHQNFTKYFFAKNMHKKIVSQNILINCLDFQL
jgi:hypothetical protein